MKKLIFAFCLLMGVGAFCSCSSEEDEDNGGKIIWDFAPFSLTITPVDEQGNIVMSELDGAKVTATWRGNVYEKDSSMTDIPFTTRYYLPTFYGLMSNDTSLVFGEFDREQSYQDEKITIDWCDGQKDVIVFSHKLKWEKGDEGYEVPESDFDIKLNGKPAGVKMRIVKK